jgi:hypothetical protein
MNEHQPTGDEEIVNAPSSHNPGAEDGVGEHVLEGVGHDGVDRMDGRFGDLDGAEPTSDDTTPADPSTATA